MAPVSLICLPSRSSWCCFFARILITETVNNISNFIFWRLKNKREKTNKMFLRFSFLRNLRVKILARGIKSFAFNILIHIFTTASLGSTGCSKSEECSSFLTRQNQGQPFQTLFGKFILQYSASWQPFMYRNIKYWVSNFYKKKLLSKLFSIWFWYPFLCILHFPSTVS